LTNYFGCSTTNSVSITQPLPLVYSSSQSAPENGANGWIELFVDGGTPPYQFEWNVKGNSNILLNVQQGYYACQITDSNGCQIDFETSIIDLSNSELQSSSLLRWNSNVLLLEVPFNSRGMLSIFDSKGALVLEQIVNSNDTIDLSQFPNGIYSISFLKSNVDSFESMTVVINK
jgi:hypothetical protein